MYFPVKIFTTPESFLKISLSLPVFAWFKTGFKPDRVIGRDRKWFPQITCMTGEDATCLHFYILAFGFRIRSNIVMKQLEEKREIPPARFLYHTYRGWQQVFQSAII